MQNEKMQKRMIIMLIGVGILFGGIFISKLIGKLLFQHFMAANQSPPVTVSAMQVEYATWLPLLKATGSVRAIRGVNVTSELAGMVSSILFTPGAIVKKDTVLVQLNANSDIGTLQSLQAQAELAKITYTRDQAQYKVQGISKATLDADAANLKNLQAQVIAQTATVEKKTIRAPFDGRLGISAVSPGQYVNPGDKVVTLQQLDPIYVDFYLPQQQLTQLKVGQDVKILSDTFPGKVFTGKITTINPLVDSSTRNVEIEATVDNPTLELLPGMFTTVQIVTGETQRFLTLPLTAISFNPYGQVVYIIRKTGEDNKHQPILTVTQSFVTTGEARGDQVKILDGLKEGDLVVTSGQLKLKNGNHIIIDNSVIPTNNPVPVVADE